MQWSFKIARVAGIDVQIHWTFGILLIWLAAVNLASGKSFTEAAWGIAFVLAIFGCVILHEFGHALVAKGFGIKTADITLLPIGGVARLQRMPEEPKQELLIAIAGPAVNVIIAGLLILIVWLSGGDILPQATVTPNSFWGSLLMVNISLVVFNMIPAFPMDGGRILRAVLAEYMDYVRATEIAANIGQFIAIGFGILGLFFNWFLLFIALFVYVGASAEAQMVMTRAMLSGAKVRDAMMTRFVTVSPHDPIQGVVEQLLAGDQQEFPVVDAQNVVGMVRRRELIQAIANGAVANPIASIMLDECLPIDENSMLRDTFESMQKSTCHALPVLRHGQLVGLLTQDNIAEWLMIRAAKQGVK